jgi:3-methyladenine DNA glycosylase/8-oxoguanine DNA glycosylase
MTHGADWASPLPDGREARARQLADGRVAIRASDEDALCRARFQLALADDTAEFHRRFRADPLLGSSARALVGYRTLRVPTVAHAALIALTGQLIQSREALAIQRRILRRLRAPVATRQRLSALSPADLRSCGLAQARATGLARLVRAIDLEGLSGVPTRAVRARLTREPGIGPWTVGMIVTRGLGRYDHGLVGDLGLIKLGSALRGRWMEAWETEELLEPYGEWQGLASALLLIGFSRGLIPGANADVGRLVRARERHAA